MSTNTEFHHGDELHVHEAGQLCRNPLGTEIQLLGRNAYK